MTLQLYAEFGFNLDCCCNARHEEELMLIPVYNVV